MTDEKAREGKTPTAAQVIADLRGGWGTVCDFCGDAPPRPQEQIHPEEAGQWVCNTCLDRWEYGAREYDRGKAEGIAETLEACAEDIRNTWNLQTRRAEIIDAWLADAAEMRKRMRS